jgi:hypothetical protein
MNLPHHLGKHFIKVYNEGNWTSSNLKDMIADITLEEANTRVYSCNTIASLVFHVNYYVAAVTQVLRGRQLDASD